MPEFGLKERSLDATATWAVAVVCLVLVSISLLLEHALHAVAKWFKKLHKPALVGALEKVETELMLMGFISLLLTVGQGPISGICISPKLASTWLPCDINAKETAKVFSNKITQRRLLHLFSSDEWYRRRLAAAPTDKCSEKGKVAFVSAYGINQLHYLIFVLAVFHIVYCIITYMLSRSKMRIWKYWESETRRMENQDFNAKDTSFGRRHLTSWTHSSFTLWIVCFFRQFFASVTSVDYRTLRHGFIMAHFAPGAESRFDFHDYINRSLEEDFKQVVGIPFSLWLIALFFLLAKTNGLYSYYWLPFLPLLVTLVVGTKLQVIMTQLGLRIQEKGEIVKGRLVVQPGDDLFWFGKPRFILYLIHLVLFQNAFQLAFFIWGWWKFGISSCLHAHNGNIAIRVTMGILIQGLCSYVTLPLYSLVSQMGSNVRPTIFNDRVATALKKWHESAKKKRAKESKHSESVTINNNTANASAASTPRDSCHHHHRCRDCNRVIDDSELYSPKKRGNEAEADAEFASSGRPVGEGGSGSKSARSGKVMPVHDISIDVTR